MTMNTRELREQRARLIRQAREVLERAEREKRGMTAEEQQQYDRIMAEVDNLRETIERAERQAELERELEKRAHEPHRPEPEQRGERGTQDPRETEEYRRLFEKFLRYGKNALTPAEYRALQADVDDSGGYLIPPQQFVRDLIKAVDDRVYLRQWATIRRLTSAQSMGAPSLDTDPDDADWTSELATGSEDSSMAFGKRELKPNPLAKRIKVSRKLLRLDSNAEGLVRDRLAYKFAITFEKALLTGTGVGQPLGVFTASSMGISTARDVSTDNTTTSITFDGLINAKYTLKSQYWPRARWLFHRDAVKQIAKLKDSNGQYIWRESVRVGEPDRVLGIPLYISEYVPNTFTTGQYVGILGDFSYIWIVESMQFELQRLDELYAETNQVGFIGRMEADAMPVLEEAFVRVQLA